MTIPPAADLSVERLMQQIEDEARRVRRARMLAHGGAREYDDPAVFAGVERILRRAIEERNRDVLLLPELLSDEPEWRLETELRLSSHRSILGPFILFAKRRLLQPMMRWLYEYTHRNFRRQQRINELLFACVEELAIENARLIKTVARLERGREDIEELQRDRR